MLAFRLSSLYVHRFVYEFIATQPNTVPTHSISPAAVILCRASVRYIDVICMHSAMLNDDTSSHRCVLAELCWPETSRLTFRWTARQSVIPTPHHFLLLVPHTIVLPQSMHRPVPARKAKGLLPKKNPSILVPHRSHFQLPERMESRPLWSRERAVGYTRLRRTA